MGKPIIKLLGRFCNKGRWQDLVPNRGVLMGKGMERPTWAALMTSTYWCIFWHFAFLVFESLCSKNLEWNLPLLNMVPLFEALLEQSVPKLYSALLWKIYQNQSGKLQQGHGFSIQRGVRQGDVISPIFFNAVLESAMRKWKRKLLASHGLVIAGAKITNIRYADDLMLYAPSLQDSKDMAKLLIAKLGAMGLQLNASQRKILTFPEVDLCTWNLLMIQWKY